MRSPLHLVRLAAIGCALMLLAYVFTFLPFPNLPDNDRLLDLLYRAHWEILLTAVPFCTGAAMAFFHSYRIDQGVNRSLWTEDQLDQARTWINAPVLTAAQIIAVSVFATAWMFGLATHHHIGSGIGVILAVNPITSVRTSLRKPPPSQPRIDWRQSAPIHSEHWGHPPASA